MSSTKNSNVVFGRQDYGSVNSDQFYIGLYDGVAPQTTTLVTNFVTRAGIYVTTHNLDEFGNLLPSYASIIGEIGSPLFGIQSRYAVLGVTPGNTNGDTWAGYFIGDVAYTGALTSVSDQQFKIQVKDETGILEKLLQLKQKIIFLIGRNIKTWD